MGVEDPLEMSDKEQGDIVLETQQDLDSSAEDIADTKDTHAAGGTQQGKGKGKGKSTIREGQYVSEDKANKRGKKTAVLLDLRSMILSMTSFVIIPEEKLEYSIMSYGTVT